MRGFSKGGLRDPLQRPPPPLYAVRAIEQPRPSDAGPNICLYAAQTSVTFKPNERPGWVGVG